MMKLKFKKMLSTVLSLAMVASFTAMPLTANAAEDTEVIYNETFNGYDSVSELTAEGWSIPTLTDLITEDDGSGKALYVGLTSDLDNRRAYCDFPETLTTGKYIIEYSMKPGDLTTNITLRDATTSGGEYLYPLTFMSGGSVATADLNANPGDATRSIAKGLAHNVWYDVKATLDMDAKTIVVELTDEAGNTYSATQTLNKYHANMKVVDGIYFQVWSKTNSGTAIDNLSIKKVVDKPTEGYYVDSHITEKNYLSTNLDEIFKTGNSYKFSWNMKPADTSAWGALSVNVTGGDKVPHNEYGILFMYQNQHMLGLGDHAKIGNIASYIDYIAQNGVDMSMLWNTATGMVDISVKISDKTYNMTWNPGVITGKYGNLVIGSGNTNVTITDLAIELVKPVPTVGAEDVVFATDDGTVQSHDAVNPLSSNIKVDFGMEMDEATMHSDSIYLENTQTGKKVGYAASYADGIYEMKLAEKLAGSSTYNLVIKNTVKSAEGCANAEDLTFAITTSAGVVIEPDSTSFPYNEEFDDYAAKTDMPSNWAIHANHDLIDEEDGSGKMLQVVSPTAWSISRYTFDNPVTDGKIEIKYSMKPSTGTAFVAYMQSSDSNSNNYYPLTHMNQDDTNFYMLTGTNVWSETRAEYQLLGKIPAEGAHVWYDVTAVVDVTNKKAQVTVVTPDGTVVQSPNNVFTIFNTNMTNVSNIYFQIWGDGTVAIDNFSVKKIMEDPSVTDESVTLTTAMGEVEENFSAVNPLVNKVSINFNTDMDVNTLTSENIKLTKGETEIPYTASYKAGVVTLNLDEILEENSDYVLTISENVANANGVALGESASISFTTKAAQMKAVLSGVKSGDTEITKLSQLAEGDVVTIEMDYENSTGKDKKVYIIACYYIDDMLVSAEYIEKVVDKDIKAATYKCEHTVADTENVDTLKIMAWDGFDTMRPVSPLLILK